MLDLKPTGASISTIYEPGLNSLNKYFPLTSVFVEPIGIVGAAASNNFTGILLIPNSPLLFNPSLLTSFQTKSPSD